MSDDVKTDAELVNAVDFLASWPGDHIHLTAIDPNTGKILGHSFDKTDNGKAVALKAMERATANGRGLYFNGNGLSVALNTRTKPKANETEVNALHCFHVDADVDKSITDPAAFEIAKADLLERVKAQSPPPSVIIDSGNGFGVFWLLREPMRVIDANRDLFKRINIALRDAIGEADSCQNLDRVMRVPFTVNFPNAAKRKRGRTVVPTRLVCDDRDFNLYTVDMFDPAPEVETGSDAGAEAIDVPDNVDFDRLNDPAFVELLKHGPKDGAKYGDGSRSAFTYAMACELRRAGFTDGEIIWTITNPDFAVAAHILDQKQRGPDPVPQAMRVIDRMNKEGIAVEPTAAESFTDDTADAIKSAEAAAETVREKKRTTWALLKKDWVYVDNQEVFLNRNSHKVLFYTVKGFNNKFAYLRRDLELKGALTTYVFDRRPGEGLDTFESFCYMPGKSENYDGDLNLWRPSPIVPKQGDAQWFFDHLLWLFGKDAEHVLNWCAWVYRFQHLHPKHALLTHGEIQGTGKSVVANVLKRLLGIWNCTMLDQGALDLEHDGWKVRTKLLVIEEVRPGFGSNNALMKKLHPLISEDTVHVDMKNKNDFDMPNVMAGLFGSNKEDALTMDDSDRRFLIVSTDRDGKILQPKPDTYYHAIYGVNGVGGKLNDPDALAAVAWELKHRDLKGYSAQGRAPSTVAKTRMIEAGSSELQKWLLDGGHVSGHKLVAVDRIVQTLMTVAPDIEKRHKGNLRNDIAEVLRRKLSGVQVKNQIRPYGSAGNKIRVWALGKDAETMAALKADKLGEIWRAEYGANAPGSAEDDFA